MLLGLIQFADLVFFNYSAKNLSIVISDLFAQRHSIVLINEDFASAGMLKSYKIAIIDSVDMVSFLPS